MLVILNKTNLKYLYKNSKCIIIMDCIGVQDRHRVLEIFKYVMLSTL